MSLQKGRKMTNTQDISALSDLLEIFGCKCVQTDLSLLEWAVTEAENYAGLELNIRDIPAELKKPLLNIAAGKYLKVKKALGPEVLEGIDLAPAVKRIEVGDTNTEFNIDGSSTPEQRFDMLTEYLIKSGMEQLKGYRRLKW